MLAHVLTLFKGLPASEPLPDSDARLALGALLVRLIRADERPDAEHVSRIEAVLARLSRLGPIDAAKMRTTCEMIEAEAPSTRKLALIIRETVSLEARLEAVEALWHSILTDNILADRAPDAAEMAMPKRLCQMLGLSKVDCEGAKARATPL